MTQQQVIANYRRNLLVFAEHHGIAEACRVFKVSRTTFYKIKAKFLETGSLEPRVRRRPRMPNEISADKKRLLLDFAKEHPVWGPRRYAACFRQQGLAVAQATIWYHLNRLGLAKRYQRLVYLESLKTQGQPVTEKNLRAIRRQCQEIKRGLWPGHVVALDTFYVGTLKGVGRIYQITGLDLCSRYGWAWLYTNKEQTSTVDFVERQLVPRFFNNNVPLEPVLTDNGSEFIGQRFRQLLDDYQIQHHRIPKGKPLLNGYCERFQRTIHEEFYQKAFRSRFFASLADLNQSLPQYLVFYNFERRHFGLSPLGEIPIHAFKSKRSFLRQRFQELLT